MCSSCPKQQTFLTASLADRNLLRESTMSDANKLLESDQEYRKKKPNPNPSISKYSAKYSDHRADSVFKQSSHTAKSGISVASIKPPIT